MKTINLTQGKVALVDDSDFEWLSKYSWCHGNGYAVCCGSRVANGKKCVIRMHRIIVNALEGMEVDHVNRDKLDNRRGNLRICTPSQNRINCVIRAHNKSGFKGVFWNKRRKKFVACIRFGGKQNILGYYETAQEAAKVYDEAAKKYHGEFARLNSY